MMLISVLSFYHQTQNQKMQWEAVRWPISCGYHVIASPNMEKVLTCSRVITYLFLKEGGYLCFYGVTKTITG